MTYEKYESCMKLAIIMCHYKMSQGTICLTGIADASSVDSDQPVYPQTDQCLLCPPEDALGYLATHRVSCKDSDQTARKRRLICVLAGYTCDLEGNSVSRLKQLFHFSVDSHTPSVKHSKTTSKTS